MRFISQTPAWAIPIPASMRRYSFRLATHGGSKRMNLKEAVIECVPNFSEGTHPEIVRKIVQAMKVEGVSLLDYSLDADHNRSVVTIAGAPEPVLESVLRGVGMAVERI